MIKSYTNGEWKEPGSLCQAVGIYKEDFYKKDFHKIVSVVGGGGKTTVIRTMLRECMETCAERIPCVVSTTTHIQKLNAGYFLGEPSLEIFRQKLSDYGAVWMGREIRQGKLASFPEEFMEEICREPVLLLLEADGAKHFPVKAPAGHEPVICEKTDIVLNVYGMCAIGQKIKDVCFRIGEVEKILGKTGEDILCPEDIVTLAVSKCAGRKCVTDDMEYQVVLNQADTEEQKWTAIQLAEDIGKRLSERYVSKKHISKKYMSEKHISEKNTKETDFPGQISKVHVVSDLIPAEERW